LIESSMSPRLIPAISAGRLPERQTIQNAFGTLHNVHADPDIFAGRGMQREVLRGREIGGVWWGIQVGSDGIFRSRSRIGRVERLLSRGLCGFSDRTFFTFPDFP
jgi:hypothetical protein